MFFVLGCSALSAQEEEKIWFIMISVVFRESHFSVCAALYALTASSLSEASVWETISPLSPESHIKNHSQTSCMLIMGLCLGWQDSMSWSMRVSVVRFISKMQCKQVGKTQMTHTKAVQACAGAVKMCYDCALRV